uniref:Uncharacterized protein n=1 Tax=Mycena chlorophos TaxID=658473 RepID=A0ABQ0LN96_MYCCL|nr:predicted protein [Mycena chlorophos]
MNPSVTTRPSSIAIRENNLNLRIHSSVHEHLNLNTRRRSAASNISRNIFRRIGPNEERLVPDTWGCASYLEPVWVVENRCEEIDDELAGPGVMKNVGPTYTEYTVQKAPPCNEAHLQCGLVDPQRLVRRRVKPLNPWTNEQELAFVVLRERRHHERRVERRDLRRGAGRRVHPAVVERLREMDVVVLSRAGRRRVGERMQQSPVGAKDLDLAGRVRRYARTWWNGVNLLASGCMPRRREQRGGRMDNRDSAEQERAQIVPCAVFLHRGGLNKRRVPDYHRSARSRSPNLRLGDVGAVYYRCLSDLKEAYRESEHLADGAQFFTELGNNLTAWFGLQPMSSHYKLRSNREHHYDLGVHSSIHEHLDSNTRRWVDRH